MLSIYRQYIILFIYNINSFINKLLNNSCPSCRTLLRLLLRTSYIIRRVKMEIKLNAMTMAIMCLSRTALEVVDDIDI